MSWLSDRNRVGREEELVGSEEQVEKGANQVKHTGLNRWRCSKRNNARGSYQFPPADKMT